MSSRRRKPPLPCRLAGGLLGASASLGRPSGARVTGLSFSFASLRSSLGAQPWAVRAAKAKPFCQALFAMLQLWPCPRGVTKGSRMAAETSAVEVSKRT